MAPARRPLKALGSLQLVGYANNPTRVITELAFITDKQMNVLVESGQSDLDTPLEVQFEEFMDGVNCRGKGTKARQRKMTVEQAAAVLLVIVQRGHCELVAKKNDPHTIDIIKILPEAKRILAAFLPKLRGYGDIPYDQQYRGAIALAKRHFFPKGKAPTKKELMALLLQTYQEKRELALKCQTLYQPTKTFGVQTSLETMDDSSQTETASGESAPCVHLDVCTNTAEILAQLHSQGTPRTELPNNDIEPRLVASEIELVNNDENYGLVSGPELETIQVVARTPMAPQSFNPYMTPISNPRRVDHTAVTPSLFDASPTSAINSHAETAPDENSPTDEGVGELLQATAISQGRLNYWYKFVTACQKITFLEGQKEEIQREFDLTKRKLDETEQRLREADADKSKLEKWVDKLRRQVDSLCGQFAILRGMTDPTAMNNEESG